VGTVAQEGNDPHMAVWAHYNRWNFIDLSAAKPFPSRRKRPTYGSLD